MPGQGRPTKEGSPLTTPLTVRVSEAQLACIERMIEEATHKMTRADVLRRCLDYVSIQKGMLDLADHREDLFTRDELAEALVTQKQSIAHLDALLEQDRDHKG